jgi:hypothetical protein
MHHINVACFRWLSHAFLGFSLECQCADYRPCRHDCVIAGKGASHGGTTGQHKEYIIYDRNQAYPEYVVHLAA